LAAKNQLYAIPTPNLQLPLPTQPAGTSSSDCFRHPRPNTAHATLGNTSRFLLVITNPKLVLSAGFYSFAPLQLMNTENSECNFFSPTECILVSAYAKKI